MKVAARVFILVVICLIASCKVVEDPEKEYAKQENKMKNEAEKSYDADLKEHYKMQSTETKKMMHKTNKKAKKYNSYKKR